MSNMYAFVLIFPLIFSVFFRGVTFYEYQTKQLYLKEICDTMTYKVKITGMLKGDELSELKTKIDKLANFEDDILSEAVSLEYGEINSQGDISNIREYNTGYQLKKGDIFSMKIRSSNVSNYSRLENWGVSDDDSKNLYYYAKSVCRIEQIFN